MIVCSGTSDGAVAWAQQLLPDGASSSELCAAAGLVHRLLRCFSLERCSILWMLLTLRFSVMITNLKAHDKRVEAPWNVLQRNMSMRVQAARQRHFRNAEYYTKELLKRHGRRIIPDFKEAEDASLLLLYGENEAYFRKRNVEPFARHLRCYARSRGMRFEISTQALPIDNHILSDVGVSQDKDSGYYFSIRNHSAADVKSLTDLLEDFFNFKTQSTGRLADHIPPLRVNWRDPVVWGNIWAMEDQLDSLGQNGLLVFWDSDVTVRPDSWHRGIVELLLNRSASRPLAEDDETGHVFVADTFPGAECVNGGFTAIRNTWWARLFLRLWREKLNWAGTWRQGALAETILEVLGMEMNVKTAGKRWYAHNCLPLMFPTTKGVLSYRDYCDCWHETLHLLVGPYRMRRGTAVQFIDPEHLEVNFVAHNLFVDHDNKLEGMRLIPWRRSWLPGAATHEDQSNLLPPLTPFAIHWAGIGSGRLGMMSEYLQKRFNLSTGGCPRAERSQRDDFGTAARQLRCCARWLKTHQKYGASQSPNYFADIGCDLLPKPDESYCKDVWGLYPAEYVVEPLVNETQLTLDVASCSQTNVPGQSIGNLYNFQSHAEYVAVQSAASEQKIRHQWVPHQTVAMLGNWLKRNLLFQTRFGICHGTRAGWEQRWFRQALGWPNGSVIGTDISEMASSFPDTVHLDYHEVKADWISKADFVYSNALDHSYNPKFALEQWMRCVHQRGVLLLEHCTSHTTLGMRGVGNLSESDIFGASFSEYLRLIFSLEQVEIAEVLHAAGSHWHEFGCRIIVVVHRSSGLELAVEPFQRSRGPRLLSPDPKTAGTDALISGI